MPECCTTTARLAKQLQGGFEVAMAREAFQEAEYLEDAGKVHNRHLLAIALDMTHTRTTPQSKKQRHTRTLT